MKQLNLGSGTNPKKGYVNVDSCAKCNPDKVWDIRVIPFPEWALNCDRIEMDNLAEHIEAGLFIKVMNECHRILKPGGKLWLRVPHCSPEPVNFQAAFSDPMHINFFTDTTFDYYNVNHPRYKLYGSTYGIVPWSNIIQRIIPRFLEVELIK